MICQLIHLISLYIKFLFIEPRFRYRFFSRSITGLRFASCYRVRDKYASWDFHPRFMTCPSYKENRAGRTALKLLCNFLGFVVFSIFHQFFFQFFNFLKQNPYQHVAIQITHLLHTKISFG